MRISIFTTLRSGSKPRLVRSPGTGTFKKDGGQSLVETALFLPILILLICYAVDFGYFFLVAANLVTSSRNATEYSIQGFATPSQSALPSAGSMTTPTSVAALALGDLSGLANASTITSIQVCSKSIGVTSKLAQCSSFGATGASYTPGIDPEAPSFVLNRVDVTYTVVPPIPITFFTQSLLPTFAFHRQVSMRVID